MCEPFFFYLLDLYWAACDKLVKWLFFKGLPFSFLVVQSETCWLSIYIKYLSFLSGECMHLGSLSRHNKDLERWTSSASHSSWVLDKPCYGS